MTATESALRRLQRRYERAKYGKRTNTVECPRCGEQATVSEYNIEGVPPDIDVNADCGHISEIVKAFKDKKNEELARLEDRLDEEAKAIERADHDEPHPAENKRCPYCNRTHKRTHDLIKHLSTSHKDDVKHCPYCAQECAGLRGVKHHIRLGHDHELYKTNDVMLAIIAEFWGIKNIEDFVRTR